MKTNVSNPGIITGSLSRKKKAARPPLLRGLSRNCTNIGQGETNRRIKRLARPLKQLERKNKHLLAERNRYFKFFQKTPLALRGSEEYFGKILEELHDVVLIHDEKGTCIGCTAKDENDLVLPARECIGKNVSNLLPAPVAHRILHDIRTSLQTGRIQTLDYTLNIKGEKRYYEGRMIPLGKQNVVTAIRNITERKRAEEALHRREENYRVLVETISYGINEIDLDGIITQSNSAFHKMHGYADGELIGTSMLDLIASKYLKKSYHRFLRRILTERPEPAFVYCRNKTRDGRIILIKVEWKYKLDEDGNVIGIISVVTDITEQARTEKTLRQSEVKFRDMVRALHDLVIIYDREGLSLECYAKNEADLIVPIEKTVGSNIKDHLPPANVRSTLHCIGKTIDSGQIHSLEYELIIKGEKQFYEARMIPYGKQKVAAAVRNITERKKAEEALRQSEERLERALEASELGMWDYDRKTNSFVVDERWAGMLGFNVEEIVPTFNGWHDLIHPEDFFKVKRAWITHKKGLTPVCEFEVRMRTKSGDWKWIQGRGKAVQWDKRGKILRFTGTHKDIDLQKRTEQLLATSQERLQRALDASELGMWNYDRATNSLVVDERWAGMLGFGVEEIEPTFKGWYDLVHPDDFKTIKKTWIAQQKGLAKVCEFEVRMRTKSGDWKWIQGLGKPIHWGEKGKVLQLAGTIKDIDKQKRSEEMLALYQERLQRALDASELGMWNYDEIADKLVVNEQWAKMLGYSKEEIEDNRNGFYGLIHPDDTIIVTEAWRAHHKALTPVCEFEVRMRTKSGGWKWIQGRGKVVQWDKNGNPVRATGTHKDITNQKRDQEERERLEAHLRQSQKMEVIGTLAGGIAHDFNNILQPIFGYLHMALEDLPAESPIREDLEQVDICAKRARDLVKQILVFSREDEQQRVSVDICSILKESLALVHSTMPANIDVRLEIEEDSGYILGDPTQVSQVIINLLTNAYLAIGENRGTVEIGLRKFFLESRQKKFHPELREGNYLKLTIRDTGIGMDKATLERIFEPFYTTREVGEGTGLGLSVVQGVVKSHGGVINVSSVPGKGSTFVIYWPTHSAEMQEENNCVLAAEPAPKGSERVLLVDDDAFITQSVKSSLERLGYRVTVRTSSLQALDLFNADPANFDVVVTDQSMPKMTGAHLAKELIGVRPDIPIILITGLGEVLTEVEIQFLGVRVCLGKPFEAADLSRAIRGIFD